MEQQIVELKENHEISITSEEEDSEEVMDDVMDIENGDEIMEVQTPQPLSNNYDDYVQRDKSFKSNEGTQLNSENKSHVMSKQEGNKGSSPSALIRKETYKSFADLKSNYSGESPTGLRRLPQEPKSGDLHGQSRFSSQSYRTGRSKLNPSSNINQYGFGNAFYQKYQAKLKSKKKSPKILIKYLQVQMNDMGGKLIETINNNDMIRNELYHTKDKMFEYMEEFGKTRNRFDELEASYAHIDDEYKHMAKYYEFSKKQHEDVIQYLHDTEKTLKDNEKEMRNFIENHKKEIEDKRNRVVNLEASLRQTDLNLKLLKDQRSKVIDGLKHDLEKLRHKHQENDEKINDVIREVSNVDFKHAAQHDQISQEIFDMKKPLNDQMKNMKQENEVLLRELQRTQKEYRAMIKEFMEVGNFDPENKSQLLSKTGEGLSESYAGSSRGILLGVKARPQTTMHKNRGDRKMLFGSTPYSLKSSPKLNKDSE